MRRRVWAMLARVDGVGEEDPATWLAAHVTRLSRRSSDLLNAAGIAAQLGDARRAGAGTGHVV
jgi:hypothetical protein